MKKPSIGQQKLGDLSSVWVYKFNMVKKKYRLAYQWDDASRTFIALDVHQNFYRE